METTTPTADFDLYEDLVDNWLHDYRPYKATKASVWATKLDGSGHQVKVRWVDLFPNGASAIEISDAVENVMDTAGPDLRDVYGAAYDAAVERTYERTQSYIEHLCGVIEPRGEEV